jgi:hypothetical protein
MDVSKKAPDRRTKLTKLINPKTDGNEDAKEKHEPEEDEFGYALAEVDEKATFHLRCKDPYGFWYVTAVKGKTPEIFNQAFTSRVDAERAITLYLNRKK